MIIGLISSVLGLVSGIVPDIVGEFKSANAHKRELEMLTKQTELQLKLVEAQGDARFEETRLGLISQEADNFRAHLGDIVKAQFAPTGVAWVDVLNSVIRPLTACMVMLMFFVTATIFTAGTVEAFMGGSISAQTMATVIWGSMVGDAVQAVLGFLFGYRVMATRLGRSAAGN